MKTGTSCTSEPVHFSRWVLVASQQWETGFLSSTDDGHAALLTANKTWVMPHWKETQPVSQKLNGPNTSEYFKGARKRKKQEKTRSRGSKGGHSREVLIVQLVDYPLDTEIIYGIPHSSEVAELKTATKQRLYWTYYRRQIESRADTERWKVQTVWKSNASQQDILLKRCWSRYDYCCWELALPFSRLTVTEKATLFF